MKEGRLRALGTSKFLKSRFGLGYLLRMSLMDGARPDQILESVQGFVQEASISSSAGTELSIRMPKEAVSAFARLFEKLEEQSRLLGILSYGIETTTLEEVFMRIVNEDNEMLVQNHSRANQLVGSSFEERDAAQKELQKRDEQRMPFGEEQLESLLAMGRKPGDSSSSVFLTQTRVMIIKRFHQFTRSRGQWSLGLFLPILIAVAVGALIGSMPNTLLTELLGPVNTAFVSVFNTPIAAQSESLALFCAEAAGFPSSEVNYVGQNLTSILDVIGPIASSGVGPSSTNAIEFAALNNFTVLYNSSYPQDLAGAVSNLLQSAISNATDNKLTVNTYAQNLPFSLSNEQVAIVIHLFL